MNEREEALRHLTNRWEAYRQSTRYAPHDLIDDTLAFLARAQSQGEPVDYRYRHESPDGRSVWTHDAYSPWNATPALETQPLYASPPAQAVPEECPHVIWYDDAARKPELFAGHGAKQAACRRFEQISGAWNAHLFVRIANNSGDDPYQNAAAPKPEGAR